MTTIADGPKALPLLFLGQNTDPHSERGVECPGALPPASDPDLVERALKAKAALGDQVTLATEDEFAAAFALPGLAREVEWLEAVSVPERFGAVGMHYDTFESVSDQELIRVLASPAVSRPG